MPKAPRIAVLGAGITGSSIALWLARRGAQVTLVDQAIAPFTGASRWSEGKLHLGYLYSADPTLATAQHLLPGGLSFIDDLRELIGTDPTPHITPDDDVYLVHRDSVVPPDAMRARFNALNELIRTFPGADRYPGDPTRTHLRELSASEIAQRADPGLIVAGFHSPERSIDTNWVADRFIDALRAEPRIELALDTHVHGVASDDTAAGAGWRLATDTPVDGRFDAVVNALWEGRLAVDRSVGLDAPPGWSHRFRVSLFVRTAHPVPAECTVVATGPFGDIKNYDGRHYYLSWYPAGLRAEGHDVHPPRPAPLDDAARAQIIEGIRTGMGGLVPAANAILDAAESIRVEGGWVFAQGKGSLADPTSSIHRRDRCGIAQVGSYISVDTGKYSVATWLAREAVARLVATGASGA